METKDVESIAKENYEKSEPWPEADVWHSYTFKILHKKVQQYLNSLNLNEPQTVLNAGCGKTTYNCKAKMIYMDIIEEYIDSFENYIVASIENIPLPDNSIDCIICVGSVINYCDLQKCLSEFSRILIPDGSLILEFERSNSAEFLFTKYYSKTIFKQKYNYNGQIHYLWMYNEKHLFQLCKFYNFIYKRRYRYHCLSSLLYRFGCTEEKAAKYSKLDNVLQFISYPIAHNELILLKKIQIPNELY